MTKSQMMEQMDELFPKSSSHANSPVLTPSDRYVNRDKFSKIFGVPKFWPSKKWVHLIHNWRTGGSVDEIIDEPKSTEEVAYA